MGIRDWLGDKIAGLALRMIGADTKSGFAPPPIPNAQEEDVDDPDAVVPMATLSNRGKEMLKDAENARRWNVARAEVPKTSAPTGSVQDRVAKARAAAGE
jgi:hypothetical protein